MVHPDQLPAQFARRFRPEWRLVFFSAFGFGLLAHFYKMANWLPNWDSLVFRYDAQQMLQYGRWACCSWLVRRSAWRRCCT